MSSKTFKDYLVVEQSTAGIQDPINKQKLNPKIIKEKQTTSTQEINKNKTINEPSFKENVTIQEVKLEVYEKEKIKLEEKVRSEFKAEYDTLLQENIIKIKEDLTNSMLHNIANMNDQLSSALMQLIEANDKLLHKIEKLQENLNITLPTPVIQLTVPEKRIVKKVIHRDLNGNITHVTEEGE